MRDRLTEIAYAQSGPLLLRQAAYPGMPQRWLRRQHTSGRWRRLRRAVYANGTTWRLAARDRRDAHALAVAAARLRLSGDTAASLESAALLWGIDTLGRFDAATVHLTRPRRGRGTVTGYPGLTVHHAGLPGWHVIRRRGVPVTTAARTVIDIARVRSFRAGVVAADSALRQHLCSREDLLAVAADCARWPGVRRARAVAAFADPRSESALESLSRAAFHRYGLPAPALQQWVTPCARVDFARARQRVIGEADGMVKYQSPEVLRREKERQEILERLGWRIVRWTWDDVFRRPDVVAAWVEQALRQR